MEKILILSLCILFYSCSSKDNRAIKVAGVFSDSGIAIAELKINDSIYIDTIKNGRFNFSICNIVQNYIEINLDDWMPLYVEYGDSIFIDYENSKQIHFSGIGFEESKFLNIKNKLMMELGFDDPRKIDIDLFSSKPQQFLKQIDIIKHARVSQLNDYYENNPKMSSSFYNTEMHLINYFWINQQLVYPEFNEMLTNSKPNLPYNYYKFKDQIDPSIKELSKFHIYREVLSSNLDQSAKDINEKYRLAKKIFTDKEIFEAIMFDKINSHINFNGIDGIDSICADFLSVLRDSKRKNYLTDKYNSWSLLAKGKKAPEFEILDDKGNFVKLSDLIGKFVYIDCWSSFCGPCIKEMPEMKSLSEEFKFKNIIFITISADNDKEKWLRKIKEFKLTNTINLCTEGIIHKFNNDYNAKAFPRYILIDDKGHILDATASKPSMVKEELEILL